MLSRTKILVSALVAGASLAAAVPATAQNYQQNRYEDRHDRGDRYDNNRYQGNARALSQQIEQLAIRIHRNDGRDRISEREAAGLRRAISELRTQFRTYNRNGLTQREARTVQERINWVRSRLQVERNDRDGRRY